MSLEDRFTAALLDTYEVAKEHKYHATYFLKMLNERGGVETARYLLADHETQAGLFRLWELHLLKYSVEAIVLRKEFMSLFSDEEIAEAKRRLDEFEFTDYYYLINDGYYEG